MHICGMVFKWAGLDLENYRNTTLNWYTSLWTEIVHVLFRIKLMEGALGKVSI